MGTNYYVTVADRNEELHIGKSSMGWVFSLRIHPDHNITTLYDWMPIMLDNQNTIRDEYGQHITADEMLRTITVRSRNESVNWSDADWSMNRAEPGPNNLVRGKASNDRTHGEGTWDYNNYEFC